jgi:hypothetical protein
MTRVTFSEMLVRLPGQRRAGVPLTSTVGGLLVSGTIISQKRLTLSPTGSVRDCPPARYGDATR